MDALIGMLIVVGGLAAVLGGFVLLARRVRRIGVGGGLMGPIDEIYNPGAHRYREVIEIQASRAQPPATADSDG